MMMPHALRMRAPVTSPHLQVVAEANPVPVKKLGYELVRAATLSVNDWEAVATGLKADINDRKVCHTQHVVAVLCNLFGQTW